MNADGSLQGILIIILLIFVLALPVFIIWILVLFVRWIFRIDEIVELLKRISKINEREVILGRHPDLKLCEGCNRNFNQNQLTKIDSGQLLCPECINNLKKKKAKGG